MSVSCYTLANDLFLDYIMEPWFMRLCNSFDPWYNQWKSKTKQNKRREKLFS